MFGQSCIPLLLQLMGRWVIPFQIAFLSWDQIYSIDIETDNDMVQKKMTFFFIRPFQR